jgi:Holliday junction resolvasome RuvABC DNA-binding subunit
LTDHFAKVQSALMKLGFRRQEASRVLNQLRQTQADAGLEPLLRAALRLLTPGRG